MGRVPGPKDGSRAVPRAQRVTRWAWTAASWSAKEAGRGGPVGHFRGLVPPGTPKMQSFSRFVLFSGLEKNGAAFPPPSTCANAGVLFRQWGFLPQKQYEPRNSLQIRTRRRYRLPAGRDARPAWPKRALASERYKALFWPRVSASGSEARTRGRFRACFRALASERFLAGVGARVAESPGRRRGFSPGPMGRAAGMA